jgi:hypothetical protein
LSTRSFLCLYSFALPCVGVSGTVFDTEIMTYISSFADPGWWWPFETYVFDPLAPPKQILLPSLAFLALPPISWFGTFLIVPRCIHRYYTKWTRGIITTVVNKLADDPSRRFIWEEISFFERWWQEQDQLMQHKVRKFVPQTCI